MQAVMAIAGIACLMVVAIYLASMARIASLLKRRGQNDVDIGDPNGQLRLIRSVFWPGSLDPAFLDEHRSTVQMARTSGVLGLILVIGILVSIGTGFVHA